MYSDISTLIIESSVPKTASAKVLDNSVFPTPVGPRKRNEPIGLLGFLSPTLPLLTALATALTASSCPIILLCKTFSKSRSLFCSFFSSLVTGIPVHIATTSSIEFSVIIGRNSSSVPSHFAIALFNLF